MAIEKTLNTRLQMKYDSYANWTSTTLGDGKGAKFVLKAGEIGICYLPANYAENQVTGTTPPQILMKVGDGSSTFAQLPWISAKAADVYAWAKQANLPVTKDGTGNVVSGIAWDEATHGLKFTTLSVATTESFNQLAGRVQTIENTYATDTDLANAVAAINAEIAKKADKTYVDEELAKKVNVSDFNSFKTENTQVIENAVAGAEQAIVDAVGAITNAETFNDFASVEAALSEVAEGLEGAQIALQGIKNHATVDSFGDVMTEMAKYQLAGDYATKAEAQGYANAKDSAIAEAKKAGTDANAALEAYKTTNNAAVALKADQTALNAVSAVANAAATQAALNEEINRAKAAEKANADAIELLTNGVDQEKVDSVKDLIDYVEKHGPEVTKMKEDIAANTKAISDEASRADTEEKRLAGLIKDNADAISALNAADGKVANAAYADKANSLTDAAKAEVKAVKVDNAAHADSADSADNAAKLGGVVAADYATKAYADQAEADAIASANANTANVIKNYYTKTEANAAFMDATETGNAIDAKISALNLAATYEPIGAETRAKAYADGLAGNYATAAQGAKADSALQSVEVGTGLKVSAKANNKQTIEIDTDVVFVFNCGSSTTVM